MNIKLEIKHYDFQALFSKDKFLKDAVFNIPRYQRAYSWSTEENSHQNKREVDDFWGDIIERSETQKTDYFGSILLNKREDGRITKYEIVDGQQRLITALLLYKALGAEVNKTLLPISLDSERENGILQKILLEKKLKSEEKRTSISKAYDFFCHNLENKNKERLLIYFNNIQISIAIINDEYESNLLFGRLNTRGLPLSNVDLIKYEIFRHYDRCSGISGDDDPLDTWKEIQFILYNHVNKSLTIDKFIFYWWRINNTTSEFSFEKFKELYNVTNYIENFLSPILEAVKKIKKYILNDSGSDNGFSENVKRLFDFNVLHRDSGADIGLIKVLLSDVDNRTKKSIIDIMTLMEAFRYTLEVKQVNHNFENLEYFYREEILTGGEGAILDNLCKNIRKNTISNSVKSQIINSVAQLRYPTSKTKFSNGNKSAEKRLLQYTLFRLDEVTQPNKISIEHIIDKSEGGIDEESLYFQLGNTVLLEKDINSSLSGIKELEKKIPEYRNSSIHQMKDFIYRKKGQSTGWKVDRNNSWNPEKFSNYYIESRGKHMATMLFNELQKYIKEYQERQM